MIQKHVIFLFVLLGLAQNLSAVPIWKQGVQYHIECTLHDQTHTLDGVSKIHYVNHSPDSLHYVMLHIYPNAYSTESSLYSRREAYNYHTQFYFSKAKDKGKIDSLLFMVNGEQTFYSQYENNPDVITLNLPQTLAPGDSIDIYSPFHIQIPKVFSRMGHVGQSYYMTQWYPKVAVYDEHGWHPIPYVDMGEFYGEFADYDVTITLPSNYVLATSGEIQDQSEIEYLDSLSREKFQGLLYQKTISNFQKHKKDSIAPSSTVMKTVRSIQKNVHDFAWAADKQFVVRKLDTTLLGKPITIYSYIQPKDYHYWKASNLMGYQSLLYCSNHIGPYTYSQLHIIDGALKAGAGMEYPTFTIIHSPDSASLSQIIYHEVAHNWFYGMLANNERDEPFMDESFTSFLDDKISHEKDSADLYFLNNPKTTNLLNRLENQMYAIYVGQNKHVTVNQHSLAYTENPYGIMIYSYGKELIRYLSKYMGEDYFWTLLQGYYNEYSHRHTSVASLHEFAKQNSPVDINWFFDQAINNPEPIDFKIGKVKKSNLTEVTVKNKNSRALPASISYEVEGNKQSIWTLPFSKDTIITLPAYAKNISISPDNSVPETNLANNSKGAKIGIRINPLKVNTIDRRDIELLPSLGYNFYDGFMLGLGLGDYSIITKPFLFWVNPMYGFKSKSLVGDAHLDREWITYRSRWLKSIQARLELKSYHNDETNNSLNHATLLQKRYIKFSPKLYWNLDNHRIDNEITKVINTEFFYIKEQTYQSKMNPVDSSNYLILGDYKNQYYGVVGYTYMNKRLYNPYSYKIHAHINKDFLKLMAEANLKVNYNYSKKGIHFRAFAGWMTTYQNNYINSRYYLMATNNGKSDYLYENTFLGRTEQTGIWSQQMFVREGGFKSMTPLYANTVGLASQWMVTINTLIDLPFRIPLKIYADLGTFNNIKQELSSGNRMIMNTGLMLDLQILKMYVPIFNSKDYSEYNKYYADNFFNKITFQLDFNQFNNIRKTIRETIK